MAVRRSVVATLLVAGALAPSLGTRAHLAGQSRVVVGDLVRFTPAGEQQVTGVVDQIEGRVLRLSFASLEGSEQSGEYPFTSVVGLEKRSTAFNYTALFLTMGASAVIGGLLVRTADDKGFIFDDDRSQFALGASLGTVAGFFIGYVVAHKNPRSVWTPGTLPTGEGRSRGLDIRMLASPRGGLGLGLSLPVGG